MGNQWPLNSKLRMEQGTTSQEKEVNVLLSTIHKVQLHLKRDPKNPQNTKPKMVAEGAMVYVTE